MHYFLLTINWGLMILMPIALGLIIAKRRGIRWGLFAIGGATFILSQIAHIPFNWLMFNSLSDDLEVLEVTTSKEVFIIPMRGPATLTVELRKW